jgi:outer membrane lipoprotein carrier protein
MTVVHRRHCPSERQAMVLGWMALLLLVWMVISSNADTLDLNTLVDRVQANYDSTHALTANFVQVATLTSIDRQQTSSGQVSIEKPHYIRWEYTQPDSQTVLYDGALLRIYTPKRQQVLQSTIDEDDRRNVALLFLAGVGTLRETFTISPLSKTDDHMQYLRLLPRSRQASFTELHIAVNTQNYFVEKLTIHDTIGNITDIHLSSLQVHQALPPQTFDLVLPPQTEILTPTDLSGQR